MMAPVCVKMAVGSCMTEGSLSVRLGPLEDGLAGTETLVCKMLEAGLGEDVDSAEVDVLSSS